MVAVLAVLAAILLPLLGSGKAAAQRIACASNLRQLALASSSYTDDHEGRLPTRVPSANWPKQLDGLHAGPGVLRCPADPDVHSEPVSPDVSPDLAPRSFLMSGFQDYYALGNLVPPKGGAFPGLIETAIFQPSQTILFGEKQPPSKKFYLILETDASLYLSDLEERRHPGSRGLFNRTGYANYAFADSSVRPLHFGLSICPINLWAVTEEGRTTYAVCRPH